MKTKYEETVMQLIQDMFGENCLTSGLETPLDTLNASSMQSVMLMSKLEEKFNIEIPMQDFYTSTTIADLMDCIFNYF